MTYRNAGLGHGLYKSQCDIGLCIPSLCTVRFISSSLVINQTFLTSLQRWKRDKTLSFIPPDGKFVLGEYQYASPQSTVVSNLPMPVTLKPNITVGESGGIYSRPLHSMQHSFFFPPRQFHGYIYITDDEGYGEREDRVVPWRGRKCRSMYVVWCGFRDWIHWRSRRLMDI